MFLSCAIRLSSDIRLSAAVAQVKHSAVFDVTSTVVVTSNVFGWQEACRRENVLLWEELFCFL